MNKLYPVGTKVRYVGSCKHCKGTTGKIISAHTNYCRVNLLDSSCCKSFGWAAVNWRDVDSIGQQQLEFAFMEEDLTKG